MSIEDRLLREAKRIRATRKYIGNLSLVLNIDSVPVAELSGKYTLDDLREIVKSLELVTGDW